MSELTIDQLQAYRVKLDRFMEDEKLPSLRITLGYIEGSKLGWIIKTLVHEEKEIIENFLEFLKRQIEWRDLPRYTVEVTTNN